MLESSPLLLSRKPRQFGGLSVRVWLGTIFAVAVTFLLVSKSRIAPRVLVQIQDSSSLSPDPQVTEQNIHNLFLSKHCFVVLSKSTVQVKYYYVESSIVSGNAKSKQLSLLGLEPVIGTQLGWDGNSSIEGVPPPTTPSGSATSGSQSSGSSGSGSGSSAGAATPLISSLGTAPTGAVRSCAISSLIQQVASCPDLKSVSE